MPSTLAEALSNSLPKTLQETLAEGLGIEICAVPDLDIDGVDHIEARPYEHPPTSARCFAHDAIVHISPGVMEATIDLLKAHGWHSRAWH